MTQWLLIVFLASVMNCSSTRHIW